VIHIHLYNSKLKAGDTMKVKLFWIALAMMLCCSAIYAGSTTVLGEAGSIFGASGEKFSFVSDQTPLVHRVALTDMEFKAAFDSLGVAMTTSTDNLRELLAPGMAIFKAAQGKTYFANALGAAADIHGSDLFGIRIAAVPLPSALYLLGIGILALAALKRRNYATEFDAHTSAGNPSFLAGRPAAARNPPNGPRPGSSGPEKIRFQKRLP
jgi:hypothetical protein